MSFFERSASSPLANQLLEIINRKQSNLCVSVDFTHSDTLLQLVDAVGPHVCMIKTHIDIICDFDINLVHSLSSLSRKHDFLIFEDRKFADIGNTVSLQYSSGAHKIASWSHLTNAHALPGDGIVHGLKKVGLPLNRGLLLLAQMSSAGSLADSSYTQATLDMARRHSDFVIGFIAQQRLGTLDEGFLILTPGVGLDVKGDGMGQQYRTPDEVVDAGTDVIIVGRGVTGNEHSVDYVKSAEQALRYKKAGWDAIRRVHHV
ncbi:hypothetical protein E3P92_02457 [Wallemia ichthyophaga]|nr:hypothetical protein E3P92_02457 [Wallemia ichthyophaga]TIB66585.1 hypothetical protein E3P77_02216 [Wallemia ichthyophaga]